MATTVYVEVRPNVRACNFFIKTCIILESSPVKIKATEVEVGSLRMRLPSAMTLSPESLSGLSCSNGAISFRAQIATFNASKRGELCTYTYRPNVKEHEKVILICSNCQEHLSGELSFSRILPLPSTEEFNDFFCHRPLEEKISLDPCVSDMFYNFFFFKIHLKNLEISEVANQFKCPRCSMHHGEITGNCVKCWNSTVRVSSLKFEGEQDSVLDNFLRSLKYFINDLPTQMNKFVFTCSQDQCPTRYTLVWILDQSLVLLTGTHRFGEDVILDFENVMKILYSHYTDINDEVNEWLGSFTSSVISIPPKVEHELLIYLAKMSERIPCDSNNVNGMNISYLQG